MEYVYDKENIVKRIIRNKEKYYVKEYKSN